MIYDFVEQSNLDSRLHACYIAFNSSDSLQYHQPPPTLNYTKMIYVFVEQNNLDSRLHACYISFNISESLQCHQPPPTLGHLANGWMSCSYVLVSRTEPDLGPV